MGDGHAAMAATSCLLALLWWGPGWLLGEALGVRRVLLPATAPGVGVGLLSVLGWAGRLAHVPWRLPWVLAECVLVAALAWVVRRRATGSRGTAAEKRSDRRWWLAGLAGLLPAALAGGWVWVGGTAGLRAVNQDWDMPWHASMVRLIAATARWDPHLAGPFAYYDTSLADAPQRSYPIALHALLALAWPAGHLSIPVLFDVAGLLMVAVQLPLSTMALTAAVLPEPAPVAAAGAASAFLAVYPWDLLWRGPLVPYLAGLLLVGPLVLLAVRAAQRRVWAWLPAVALSAVGLAAVHPSLLVVAAPVLLCWWAGRLLPWRARGAATTGYLVTAGAAAALLAMPVLLDLAGEAGRVAAMVWPPDTTLLGAVKDVLLLRHAGSPPMLAVAAAAAVGALALLLGRWVGDRPGRAWYLVPVALYAALSVGTIGTSATWLLRFSAPFYDDQWRIVAAFAMLALPLVGVGAWTVGRLVAWAVGKAGDLGASGRLRSVGGGGGGLAVAVCAAATLAVLAVSLPALAADRQRVARQNAVSGRTLSSGEIALLSRISRWVPANATVLNDACDGSVWMYALGDRMPMIRHFGLAPTVRQQLLLSSFSRLAEDPAVRRAAAQLGVGWVYVSTGRVRAWDRLPTGLTGLDRLPFLTLVARAGDARLYRLDWSRLPGGPAAWAAAAPTRLRRQDVPGTWSTTDPSPVVPGRSVC